MDRVLTAVVIAAYISREIRGWIVLYQSRRKEIGHRKDEGERGILSPPNPPFFLLFWRNLITYWDLLLSNVSAFCITVWYNTDSNFVPCIFPLCRRSVVTLFNGTFFLLLVFIFLFFPDSSHVSNSWKSFQKQICKSDALPALHSSSSRRAFWVVQSRHYLSACPGLWS